MVRALAVGGAGLAQDARCDEASGLHVGGVVQHDQRLEGRVRSLPADGAGVAHGRVKGGQVGGRRGALPEGVERPAVQVLLRTLGVADGVAAAVAHREPDALGLIRPDARSAHGLVQEPGHVQGLVPEDLRVEAEARAPGQQAVVRVDLELTGPDVGVLAVGAAEHQPLVHGLHVPAALHEGHGEPVQQLGVTRPLALVPEVVRGGDDAGPEEVLPGAVDPDPRGERVVARDDPAREAQAVAWGICGEGRER